MSDNDLPEPANLGDLEPLDLDKTLLDKLLDSLSESRDPLDDLELIDLDELLDSLDLNEGRDR